MHSFIALLLRPYTKAFLYSRTTDAQRGNSLHCMAENSIPIPNFQVRPKHILSATDFFDLCLHWVSVVRGFKHLQNLLQNYRVDYLLITVVLLLFTLNLPFQLVLCLFLLAFGYKMWKVFCFVLNRRYSLLSFWPAPAVYLEALPFTYNQYVVLLSTSLSFTQVASGFERGLVLVTPHQSQTYALDRPAIEIELCGKLRFKILY